MKPDQILPTGVWADEQGRICRRDTPQNISLTVYVPKTPDDAEKALRLARQLHSGVIGGSFWGTQGEKAQDDLLASLRQHIIP